MRFSNLIPALLTVATIAAAESSLSYEANPFPLVVTTWATDGFKAATEKAFLALTKEGYSRIGALVEGLSECEKRACDTTVGAGGSPDENGETTLDAMLFDGPGHRVSAVAGLRRVADVARVAWAVMNYTKHTMLAGDLATQFALDMGFAEKSLSSNWSSTATQKWRDNKCQPNFRRRVVPNPLESCGPYRPEVSADNAEDLCGSITNNRISELSHDTIGQIIIDGTGKVSAGTSTNGAIHKVPGRIGDSPIPGAGCYADAEVGAAAATGDGDTMMRFLPSYQAVESMRAGVAPDAAAEIAIRRITTVYGDFRGAVIAASLDGRHGAACHGLHDFTYSFYSRKDSQTQTRTVICVTH